MLVLLSKCCECCSALFKKKEKKKKKVFASVVKTSRMLLRSLRNVAHALKC